MALIKCEDCSREISEQATACPQCGRPVRVVASEPVSPVAVRQETTLLEQIGCLYPMLILGVILLVIIVFM